MYTSGLMYHHELYKMIKYQQANQDRFLQCWTIYLVQMWQSVHYCARHCIDLLQKSYSKKSYSLRVYWDMSSLSYQCLCMLRPHALQPMMISIQSPSSIFQIVPLYTAPADCIGIGLGYLGTL